MTTDKFTLVFNTTKKVCVTKKIECKYNVIHRRSQDLLFNIIPNATEQVNIFLLSPNRRIKDIFTKFDVDFIENMNLSHYNETYNCPYIMLENVFDTELLNEIKAFYMKMKKCGKLIAHQHSTKDRLHVHPDISLTKKIDSKLSRTILPELRKLFYFDCKYREDYKICSYDSETSGRFHAHRDTPAPYQHRKYAMSLFLNDDYEGGELSLVEYGITIKPKANTAVIFPGICTHKVNKVTQGSRMVMITFFVNGKSRPQYKMKSNFYDEKGVVESSIFPF